MVAPTKKKAPPRYNGSAPLPPAPDYSAQNSDDGHWYDSYNPASDKFDPGRAVLGLGTLGATEFLPGGYQDQDKNARDAKNGLANQYRQLGEFKQGVQDRTAQQKAGAKSNYDRSSAMLDYGWQKPTQVQDWYYGAQRKYQSTNPYAVQDYQRGGTNTVAGDYYRNYTPVTTAATYQSQRQANSGGPNRIDQRYKDLSGEGPGYVAGDLGAAKDFIGAPTRAGLREGEIRSRGQDALDAQYSANMHLGPDALDQRMDERRRLGPDMLDLRYKGRDAYNQTATASSGILGETGDPSKFTRRSDALAGSLGGQTYDKYTGQVFDNAAGRNNDVARFEDSYDPNDPGATGDNYGRLRSEGPTYEEDFYNSQVTGNNPAYNQLREDAMRDSARGAAARGGFVSGRALDLEGRTSARLAADEFARRGDLAAAAGNSRRALQGLQSGAASAYDSNQLGRNQLGLTAATTNDKYISDLGMKRDELNVTKYGDMKDLAKFADTQGMTLEQLRGEVAHNQDMTMEDRQKAMDNIAKALSDRDAARQTGLDTVASGLSNRDAAREREQNTLAGKMSQRDVDYSGQLNDLYKSEDATATSRRQLYGDELKGADTYHTNQGAQLNDLATGYETDKNSKQKQLDELSKYSSDEALANQTERGRAAGKASDEAQNVLDYRQRGAANADVSDLNRDKYMGDLAKMSSDEVSSGQKDLFGAQMQLGDAQTSIDRAYDMAANGTIDEASLAQIDSQLAASGVDAQRRAAIRDDLLNKANLAVSAARTVGGAPPAPRGGNFSPGDGYSVYPGSSTPVF